MSLLYKEIQRGHLDAWVYEDKLIVHVLSKHHYISQCDGNGLISSGDKETTIFTGWSYIQNKRLELSFTIANKYEDVDILKLFVVYRKDKFVILDRVDGFRIKWAIK